MRKQSIWIVMCLALCLAVSAFGSAAAEQSEMTDTEEAEFSFQFRVTPEEAERQFLNGLFGLPVTPVSELPRMRGTAGGDSFTEGSREKKLYTALRNRVEQVAAGTLTSTQFKFDENSGGFEVTEFTAEDLGIGTDEMFGSDGKPSETATMKIREKIFPWVTKVINAVLFDCPYETFWRDNNYIINMSRSWYQNGQGESTEPIAVVSITIIIYVSDAYQADGDLCTVDYSRIDYAKGAISNADEIISANAGLDDYGKLTAYKDAIRGLTDYNQPATASGYPYGDPWQMVYVFDKLPETKVVCEGYSKAFYYLCDNSIWSDEDAVKVICVSGNLWNRDDENSAFRGGAHMWNIVRMNGQNYMADVTNTDQNPGLFLDGYDRHDETEDIYFYSSGHYYPSGALRELGYSFDDETVTLLGDDGWLDLAAEEAPYPNEYETGNIVWGISKTQVLPGEDFTVYATYNGPEADELILRMTQGSRVIRYTGEGNTISGVFSATNSAEPVSIECLASIEGDYVSETYPADLLTVAPGTAAPVPAITVTGDRALTGDGSVCFVITAEAPDGGDYSDVRYEITPIGEDGDQGQAIGDFAAGITQTVTMDRVRQTGLYIAEDTAFRLQVRAYGPGYESETAASAKLYVTGTREQGFSISAEYMTGSNTAQMQINEMNSLTVTAPEGVESIQVCKGDNNWINYSIDLGDEILIDGYAGETRDMPLAARYTNPAGEKRYSNVIFVDYVETPDYPFLTVDKTSVTAGEDITITAHLPRAGHIRVGTQEGVFVNDYFTGIQEGDTATWTTFFDYPGEYTLFLTGWSDERWINPDIPNVTDFPDMGWVGYLAVPVTVTAQEEQGPLPEATVTIPEHLSRYESIEVEIPEFPAAISYSVICRRTDNREIAWSRTEDEPFDTSISCAQLEENVLYDLEVKVRRNGYASYTDHEYFTIWAPIMPEAITPGEDMTITLPPKEGAVLYELCVETSGIVYYVKSDECGDFVIPAMVFADGGGYTINIYVYRASESPEEDDDLWARNLYWGTFNYDAEAYTGAQTLTISAGTYHDSLQTINLSVADADQVIIQEKEIVYWGYEGYECWTTVNVTDNPGEAVNVRLLATKEHEIRAAVKRSGEWSAWSPVIGITSPAIHGRCSETIEWTLSDSGILTISGTGVLPNYMEDPLDKYIDEITEVVIGEGVSGIQNYTFGNYANLTSVTIPASLTSIGEGAFCDCESLTGISSPGAETTTYKRCYDGSIKVFSLPSTVSEIGYAAFFNTPAFGENTPLNPDFEIPADTGRIEEYAFYGIAAIHIRMTPYGLNSCTIGEYAFGKCTALRYFQVDDWYEEVEYHIAEHAFDECSTELVFIGEDNAELEQFATEHGFTYLENEAIGGNG